MTAAVDLFYGKVLADARTEPFFAALDMDRQIKKQIAFMARAFGGPDEYAGRDLRKAHATLVRDKGLSDIHFDAVARHLKDTLVELNIPPDLIAEALGIIAGTRDAVLGRSPTDP